MCVWSHLCILCILYVCPLGGHLCVLYVRTCTTVRCEATCESCVSTGRPPVCSVCACHLWILCVHWEATCVFCMYLYHCEVTCELSVPAVLVWLITSYQHSEPEYFQLLAEVRIEWATDCSWSCDGHVIVVWSTLLGKCWSSVKSCDQMCIVMWSKLLLGKVMVLW